MLDLERRLAITELLAQPDPPELRRAHRLRLAGKPERFELVPQLSAVFVQAKLLALHERCAENKEAHTRTNVVVEAARAFRGESCIERPNSCAFRRGCTRLVLRSTPRGRRLAHWHRALARRNRTSQRATSDQADSSAKAS